jgi:hypothetical protein
VARRPSCDADSDGRVRIRRAGSGYYAAKGPKARLLALRMLLHRAARAMLDPKIHRGDLTPDQAVRFLADSVGISEARAQTEVTARYIPSPGSAATYLVGKRQIEQLRRQVQEREGVAFTLKPFHDRLLSAGAAPVQTIARDVFHLTLDAAGILRSDPADSSSVVVRPSATGIPPLLAAAAAAIALAAAGLLYFRASRTRADRVG